MYNPDAIALWLYQKVHRPVRTREMDYFICDSVDEVNEKAVELIQADGGFSPVLLVLVDLCKSASIDSTIVFDIYYCHRGIPLFTAKK